MVRIENPDHGRVIRGISARAIKFVTCCNEISYIYLIFPDNGMLTNLKEVLCPARAHQYAVPAFDCVEDVMVRAILETAEERRAPVVLMCLVGPDVQGNGWVYVSGLIKAVADHHKIPVVLHLDHALNLDQIARAVEDGFSSVMIDGSRLSFEENILLTKQAVDIAHPYGVSVEGELGHVGGMDAASAQADESMLTRPDEVAAFVAQTKVDALAVSIGTVHGIYQARPRLDIKRLKELNMASPVPLVLHGGSDTPDDQIQNAVRNGICKINIYTDARIAMRCGLKAASTSLVRGDPTPQEIFGPIKAELARVVARKIDLFFASNRA